ncbi:hypothetical protein OD754_10775 [Rhodobacter capsulatus]|uniref:hypothetical protein n=1 Tax=Rhodobacter capsulatus TaxID=1061 RepID=UPI0028748C30|nr:hypothetical protein [Rhodobacter capsulatus]MDS0927307.1 hypothetical protein [Rhodobacter capsulatus]UYE93255.1 hypothetical protein Jorvik_06 [Rhodobacter phage Jorvik]
MTAEKTAAAALSAGPEDPIPDFVTEPDAPEAMPLDAAPDDLGAEYQGEFEPEAEAPAILSPEAWHAQTFMTAHMVGTAIACAKTGREVDLVGLAMSEHGRAASGALYRVLDRYDFARRWFLTEGSNVMMDLGVILSYGQAVASAIKNAPEAPQPAQ